MSYYVLVPFFIIMAIAVYIVRKQHLLDRYPVETRNGLTFLMITIPVMLLLIRLERSLQLFTNAHFIIKGMALALIMLVADLMIYAFISRLKI